MSRGPFAFLPGALLIASHPPAHTTWPGQSDIMESWSLGPALATSWLGWPLLGDMQIRELPTPISGWTDNSCRMMQE